MKSRSATTELFSRIQKIAVNEVGLEANVLGLAKQVPEDKDGSKLVANPNKTWKDVDPSLPNTKIEVLGPPPTGTRDAFNELAIERLQTFPSLKAMKKQTRRSIKRFAAASVRTALILKPARTTAIVQKLEANQRLRRLRLQLPRPECRQDPGQPGEWRRT